MLKGEPAIDVKNLEDGAGSRRRQGSAWSHGPWRNGGFTHSGDVVELWPSLVLSQVIVFKDIR